MAQNTSVLRKRLLLLAFGRGVIFWYAVEKLFQLDIGLSMQDIVLLGVIMQGSKLLFELPTSIYADRWSRKNTLIASELMTLLCSLTLGLASNLAVFAIGGLMWALGDALMSGVYQAFTYDSLAVRGQSKQFRSLLTRMLSVELGALAVCGLLAGPIAQAGGFRLTFFLTMIPPLLNVLLLSRMEEPAITRTSEQGLSWWRHLGGSAKIMKSRQVIWPIMLFVGLMGFRSVWFDFYQLVGISVALPQVVFGSLLAILTISMAIGAELAHKRAGTKRVLLVVWLGLMLSHTIGLRLSTAGPMLANLFVVFLALRMLQVYLEVYLHEHIPSERRATILSLASSLAYGWFFVLAFGFAQLLERLGVRMTFTLVSLPLLGLGVVDIARRLPWATKRQPPADTVLALEGSIHGLD